MILLTDGLANEGIIDPEQLVQVARNSAADASTTTIGFGEGFDEDLLAAIADSSGASTYFAESPEDAPGIFGEEFEGLTSLVAQNLSVEIRPLDPIELVGVLNDYPNDAVPGGVQVQMGDAFGGEKRRVVFALHLPNLAALGPAKVAEVVLRYVDVGELNAHEVTLPVVVNLVSADEAAAAGINADVTDEVWLLKAAHARREAMEARDLGDYDGSSQLLFQMSENLLSAAPMSAMRRDELIAEAELLAEHAETAKTNDPMFRKNLSQEHWRQSRGRPRRQSTRPLGLRLISGGRVGGEPFLEPRLVDEPGLVLDERHVDHDPAEHEQPHEDREHRADRAVERGRAGHDRGHHERAHDLDHAERDRAAHRGGHHRREWDPAAREQPRGPEEQCDVHEHARDHSDLGQRAVAADERGEEQARGKEQQPGEEPDEAEEAAACVAAGDAPRSGSTSRSPTRRVRCRPRADRRSRRCSRRPCSAARCAPRR